MSRANTCLAMFYDPDLDPQTRIEVRQAFVRALRGVPAWAMHRAFDTWEATMPRRPSPAEILILAQRELAPLTDELARRRALDNAPIGATDRPRVSADAAARIMAEAGFSPQRLAAIAAGKRADDAPKPHPLEGLPDDHPEMVALRAARAAALRRIS